MKKQIFNPLVSKGFQYFDESPSVALQGDNYRTVLGDKGTALLNGADFTAKLDQLAALTPYGLPLSITNQVTLYVYTGSYNIGGGWGIPAFVNIVGVGSKENTIIIGDLFLMHTDYYSVRNLTGGFPNHIVSIDNGYLDNLIITEGETFNFRRYAGKYYNLTCLASDVLNGWIVGADIKNCTFLNNSCGWVDSSGFTTYSETGNVENCTGGDNCFGYRRHSYNTTYNNSINYKNCIGGNNCFGYYSAYSVAFVTNVNSTFENCKAGNNSFGCLFLTANGSDRSNIVFNGEFINCTAGTNSFINRGNTSSVSVLTFNGTIENTPINADTKRNFASTAKLKNVTHIGNISLIATGANLDKCKILGTIDNTSAVTPTITRCDFNTLTPYGANVTNLITESEAMNIKNINIT